jgi:glycolate oxidase iron-sulfur subunit
MTTPENTPAPTENPTAAAATVQPPLVTRHSSLVTGGARSGAEGGFVDRQRLLECVHCGLCLSACPTYVELGTEMDSPRGRIYLIRGLEEGTLAPTADVVRHLDLCLGCRACETACPSGVRYGELIEAARGFIEARHRRRWWDRCRRWLIGAVFPYPARLRLLLLPVRVLQRSGLWPLVRRVIPFLALVPELPVRVTLPESSPADGLERGRVALVDGCVGRELCGATNAATVRVLRRNGWTVLVPQGQGCCGALHLHAGNPVEARKLARGNIDAFPSDVDAVAVNAAGCGSTMKEYGQLLRDDSAYAARARAFAAKVRDVTELLAAEPLRQPRHGLGARVTVHDACHLVHGQRIREAPRALLRSIPGVEIVELEESDHCCGSAGTYNLTEPRMARRLLERKVANIRSTGATIVAAANPGCALQIQAGLRAAGLEVEVVHPVELLDRAYVAGDKGSR